MLCIVLWGIGCCALTFKFWGAGSDAQAAAASFAGALFGGGALLLGNWINRFNDHKKVAQEQACEVKKLKALIAAKLIDVVRSLLQAKSDIEMQNMRLYQPPPMPFTDSLGAKLLILEMGAIDAIMTLRSNLAITRQNMDAVTVRARFEALEPESLLNGLAHDMTVLAEVFMHIAPDRKIRGYGPVPEPVTEILTRTAQHLRGLG